MSTANESSFPEAPKAPARPEEAAGAAADEVTAGEESIPLAPLPPPPSPAPTPEQLAREIRRLDYGLGCLVLLLSFLLASYAIRNSDFWMHLATGRLLAHGAYHFGQDPFSYTGSTYAVNHSWLFDLGVYGLTSLAGGPEAPAAGIVLVGLKALLMTVLTLLLLRMRREGLSLWVPTVCTILALFVISPRLLYQPTVLSFFFVGLTLYILQLPRHAEQMPRGTTAGPRNPLAVYWALPPLFILWVNLDSWFVLGPVTVALYLVGQALQQTLAPVRTGPDAPEPFQLRTLSLVLVVGLLACLLNPHHYHAFTLPVSLAAPAAVFEKDPILRRLFTSASYEYLSSWLQREPGARITVVGPAYALLLVVGLASFGMSIASATWRWWRFLIWGAFALLGLYQARNTPFFAVVAAPITALNIQDFVAVMFGRQPRVERGWRAWSLGGRVATLALVVLLGLMTWPGWLFGRPTDVRLSQRVAWSIEVDASLRAAAMQLRDWRTENLLGADDHGFNYIPDVTNYCAWYCADERGQPLEKGFFDYRLQVFSRQVAQEYVQIREILANDPGRAEEMPRTVNYQDIFRKDHIRHVILSANDPTGIFAPVWLLKDWPQWALIYTDGRTNIFRWNDPASPSSAVPAGIPRFDPSRLAFGPNPARAPDSAPPPPQTPELWRRYVYGPPARPLAIDQALRYLDYFNQVSREWIQPALVATEFAAWTGAVGSVSATPASATILSPAATFLTTCPVRFALSQWARGGGNAVSYYLRDKDRGPPGAPVLAVRAARRAVAESPNNAEAYLALANSYFMLWHSQEEHWLNRPANQQGVLNRFRLRQTQVVAALEAGLKLRPDDQDANLTLYQAYTQMQYYDLALDHLREAIEARKAAGPRPPQTRDDFNQDLENFQKLQDSLATQVTRRKNEYQVASSTQPLLGKVQMALQRGLGKEALGELLKADQTQIGVPEANAELDLLLRTGRLDDVRERLTEELREFLGAYYERYQILLAAASGDYALAGQYLDEAIHRLERSSAESMLMLVQSQTFHGTLNPRSLLGLTSFTELLRPLADFRVLRGLLSLEVGDNAAAAQDFQQAVDMGGPEGTFDFDSRPVAVRYLQLLRQSGGARSPVQ